MGGLVTEIKSAEQWKDAFATSSETGKPIAVFFYNTRVGGDPMLESYFNQLSEDFEKIIFLKVDLKEMKDVVKEAEVKTVPTFQIWQEDKKLDELKQRSISMKDLIKFLAKYGEITNSR